jgi:putative ABC transport system permease protein
MWHCGANDEDGSEMMGTWWTRLRFFLFRKDKSEVDEELQFHIERQTEANLAAGMTAEEARRQAQIAFGGMEHAREACSEARPGWWMDTLWQDVRYALRGFRRTPVFTITVVAMLTLGIGATTAVFSVVDRILFRSLPYAHDDRIVSVGLVQSLERQEFMLGGFFFDWRDHQRPFEAFASQGTYPHACDLIETNPAQLGCLNMQAGFLPLLGISPVIGRNFLPEEDRPNGPPVALISYGLWRSHYNRDPGILNRLINIDGASVRVIGVLPKDFELPTLQSADVLRPMGLDEMQERTAMPGSPMRTFARLKPGISIEQAKAELQPVFQHTQQTLIPVDIRKDFHLSVRSLRDRETQDVQLMAWILLGSVLAVLLIACANLASLMMARGAARERELAVRSALGASRGRLIRQTLTEAMLLPLGGAAAGMVLAEALLRVFMAIAPAGIPFLGRAGLDLRIALFTIVLSLGCGFLFGLIPALQRPGSISFAARAANAGKHAVLRRGLVAGQIAVSVVLLSAAALLLRSFRNMEEQRLGIDTGGVLTVRMALPQFRYDTGQKKLELYQEAETAVRRMPGVQAVGWSDSFPPGGWSSGRRFSDFAVAGKPRPASGVGGPVVYREVTPDYFRALDIPILRGRNFSEEDRKTVGYRAPNIPTIQGQHFGAESGNASEQELIVSRLMAARLFHEEDPIGQRIQMGARGAWSTVVGVAEDVKNGGLMGEDEPEVYVLRRDVPEDWEGQVALVGGSGGGGPVMVIKTALSTQTTAAWVRSQVAHLDPTVPVEIEPLTRSVDRLADQPRFETALLSFFAVAGLLLAVVGLYGVIAFLVAQRTQEIGVRMVLGATQADILRLVVGKGMGLVLAGGLAGLVAALGVSRLVKSLLFSVSAYDPVSFLAVALVLVAVALLATLIPALAATRVDPNVALRCE